MKKSIYIFIPILFAGVFSMNIYSNDTYSILSPNTSSNENYDIFSPSTSSEINRTAASYESLGSEESHLLAESWRPYSSSSGIQFQNIAATSSPFSDNNDWDNQLAVGEELVSATGTGLPIGDEFSVLFFFILIYALEIAVMKNRKKQTGNFN